AAPLFLFALTAQSPPRSTLFPYTTLFRSVSVPARFFGNLGIFLEDTHPVDTFNEHTGDLLMIPGQRQLVRIGLPRVWSQPRGERSEEHTSELQSRFDLVCRLLLETKKKYH